MKIKFVKASTIMIVPKEIKLSALENFEAFSRYRHVNSKHPKVFLKLRNNGWLYADVLELDSKGNTNITSMNNETKIFRVPLKSIEFK